MYYVYGYLLQKPFKFSPCWKIFIIICQKKQDINFLLVIYAFLIILSFLGLGIRYFAITGKVGHGKNVEIYTAKYLKLIWSQRNLLSPTLTLNIHLLWHFLHQTSKCFCFHLDSILSYVTDDTVQTITQMGLEKKECL